MKSKSAYGPVEMSAFLGQSGHGHCAAHVCFWHLADIPRPAINVRFHVLSLSFTGHAHIGRSFVLLIAG